jgi:putative ABC transport system permease protein
MRNGRWLRPAAWPPRRVPPSLRPLGFGRSPFVGSLSPVAGCRLYGSGLMLSLKSTEIIRLGVANLLVHPGRSLLTMLGILFGVCAVIATLAIVEGISAKMQEEVLKMGATNIIVAAKKPAESQSVSAGAQGHALSYGLTYDDAERIQSSIKSAEVIVPARKIPVTARYLTRRNRVEVLGTVPWYDVTYGIKVLRGRWLAPLDLRKVDNVCVLGSSLADDLFPHEEPLGKIMWLGENAYRVIGILAPRGSAGPGRGGEDYDRVAYIPLTAATRRFGNIISDRSFGSHSFEMCELHEITVKVATAEQVRPAAKIVTGLMEKFHDPQKKDWEVQVPLDRLDALARTKWLFVVLGVSIAAISLLVGGIGIMNIMLASVTERTREIGIRRAMGAKRRDIVSQFLVETVALSTTGGAVGVLVGILLAWGIPWGLAKVAEILKVGGEAALANLSRTVVTPEAVFLALGASIFVGIVSGVYPAYRAAQMDPIQALRHE